MGKDHRLDTDPRTAMINRGLSGYGLDITAHTDAGNTLTSATLQIAARLHFPMEGGGPGTFAHVGETSGSFEQYPGSLPDLRGRRDGSDGNCHPDLRGNFDGIV